MRNFVNIPAFEKFFFLAFQLTNEVNVSSLKEVALKKSKPIAHKKFNKPSSKYRT